MSTTITSKHTIGITLSATSTVIDGTIAAKNMAALYGRAGTFWTIANNGVIDAINSRGSYYMYGILLAGGGNITNAAHATITGFDGGVVVASPSTVDNAGTISGIYRFTSGVTEGDGGAVTNQAGGVITGGSGVFSYKGTLDLFNQGFIAGVTYGTRADFMGVYGAGTIENGKTGTIIGHIGVDLLSGTIINAGLIEGEVTAGVAILLSPGAADDHIIEQAGGRLIGLITGFTSGDTIDEAGITITSETFAAGTLNLFSGATREAALTLQGAFNTSAFTLASDGTGGTDIVLGAETLTGGYTAAVSLAAPTDIFSATARLTGYGDAVYAGDHRIWTVTNHGTIISTGLAGTTLAGSGVHIGSGVITNSGLIEGDIGISLSSGTIVDSGTITGTGADAIVISPPSKTATASLVLDKGNLIHGAISGLRAGDLIDFAATTITADTFASGILTLRDGSKTVEALTLTGNLTQNDFTLIAQGALGTEITIATGAQSPATMRFARPDSTSPWLSPAADALTPPIPAAAPPKPSLAPTISGWINLTQPQPTPIPTVTLQPS